MNAGRVCGGAVSPDKVDAGRAAFLLRLEPKETATIVMSVSYETDAEAPGRQVPVEKAFDHALSSTTRAPSVAGGVELPRAQLERRCSTAGSVRSSADLQIMLTDTPHGRVSLCGHPVVQHAVRPRRI